ncbi:MAG: PP2C family protein-serine/threonine phosphatase [Brevinematia bacterium]
MFLIYSITILFSFIIIKINFSIKGNVFSEMIELIFTKMYDYPNQEEIFSIIQRSFKISGINYSNITVLLELFNENYYEVIGTQNKNLLSKRIEKEKLLLYEYIKTSKIRIPFIDKNNTTLVPYEVFENVKEYFIEFESNFLIPFYTPNYDLIGLVLFKSEKVTFSKIFYLSQFLNIVSLMFRTINETEYRKTIEEDIKIASEIQKKLTPYNYIENEDFESYGIYIPAYNIGGDYLDIIENSKNYTFVIGDVSGKGISAGLVTMIVKTIINSSEISPKNIQQVIHKINKYLYKWFYDEENILTFITLLIVVFNPQKKKIYFSNSGHPPGIIIRENGEIYQLKANSRPLGLFEKIKPVKESINLKSKDLLLLYTDGLIEQIDNRGREFGTKRVEEIVKENFYKTPKEIIDKIISELRDFSKSTLSDDVCLLAVKFK